MSKKDLMERLSRASDGRTVVRRPVAEAEDSAPRVVRGSTQNTRVSGRVVRRRRKASAPPVEEAPVETVQPEAAVEAAEVVEAPPPVEEPASAPEVAPVDESVVAAPEEAPPAPESAPEPASVAQEAAPAKLRVGTVVSTPGDASRPEKTAAPQFAGLGKAVVMPPPGYDPTNPEAFHRRTAAAAAASENKTAAGGTAQADAGRARGRRRVEANDHQARPKPSRRRQAATRMDHRMRPKRRRKSSGPKVASPQPKAIKRKVRVHNDITVADLAVQLGVKATAVIKQLMGMGMMVTQNEILDLDTTTLIASEFDYTVENVGFQEDNFLQHVDIEEEESGLEPRSPVITIMGHVDHGKTTLLDAIRETSVVTGEAGGITQHIGAYQVESGESLLTFIDTPGHAAFSAMRARGAEVTDIVVLVVAADDGVQPQTVEAINHSKAANVPIIVAVNKMDKIDVTSESIKQRLSEYELVPEEWGGDTLFVEVSALKGTGISDLLETISLQAEVLDLQANSERHAEGVVLEAHMERGKGAVATVLVQSGTLTNGDFVVIGAAYGRIRAMNNWSGKRLKTAGPSTPVEVFGLSLLPDVGDSLVVVENEKNARRLTEHREMVMREQGLRNTRRRTADDLFASAGQEKNEVLYLVLKCDVAGSLQALKGALDSIDVEGSEVQILHAGVGNISESDVSLISANDGLLIGFNVKVDSKAARIADQNGCEPLLYTVIYDILDFVTAKMKGLLAPVFEEVAQGDVEVRAIFDISRVGRIAGCYVTDGKVGRNSVVRLMRNGEEVWSGGVRTLKRFKDDVKEVSSGYECGIALDGFNEIEEGDELKIFEMVQVNKV
jgi:translation initiation factor IF-2